MYIIIVSAILNKMELINIFFYCRESYEIGRGNPSVGVVKRACTLRLLANTFLEWDGNNNWQKALSAVGMSFK